MRKALCVLIAILMFSGVPPTFAESGGPEVADNMDIASIWAIHNDAEALLTVILEMNAELEQIRELAMQNEADLFEVQELIDLNYQMIQSVNTAIGFTNAQMRRDSAETNNITAEYLEYVDLIGLHFMDVDADLVGLNEQVTGLRRLQAPMIGAVLVCICLSLLTLYRLDQLMKK